MIDRKFREFSHTIRIWGQSQKHERSYTSHYKNGGNKLTHKCLQKSCLESSWMRRVYCEGVGLRGERPPLVALSWLAYAIIRYATPRYLYIRHSKAYEKIRSGIMRYQWPLIFLFANLISPKALSKAILINNIIVFRCTKPTVFRSDKDVIRLGWALSHSSLVDYSDWRKWRPWIVSTNTIVQISGGVGHSPSFVWLF